MGHLKLILWKWQSFIQLQLTKTFPRQISSDLQQITQELRLESKFQENLSTGNSAWAHPWERRLLMLWKVIRVFINRREMIFQVKDLSAKDGCWISQRQDSEGHLKELIPYSSVLCNQHFTSSSWAKLQTAGGLLEDFKTFLSRYFIAFLKINTHATHSPFCRHSERVSQGPFLVGEFLIHQSKNLCSDFSAAVGLNFISFFPPQPGSPSLPGEQVPSHIHKGEGYHNTVVLSLCSHSLLGHSPLTEHPGSARSWQGFSKRWVEKTDYFMHEGFVSNTAVKTPQRS